MKKSIRKFICTAACVLAMVFAMAMQVRAEETVYQTDRTTPNMNCSLVGIRGKYAIQQQEVMDQLNKIRYEACEQGVMHPETRQKLTLEDYVPLEWSSDLEYIARIRAAEASVWPQGTRPNGESCLDLKSPGEEHSYSENLSLNQQENMLSGINEWYAEKNAWVANGNKGLGYYTSIINPSYRYVGVGEFLNENGYSKNTVVAEFGMSTDNHEIPDVEMNKACVQTIEIKNSYLGSMSSSNTIQMIEGDGRKLQAEFDITFSDGKKIPVMLLGNLAWSSDNPEIVSVDEKNYLLAKKEGRATVTAQSDNDSKIVFTVLVQSRTAAKEQQQREEEEKKKQEEGASTQQPTQDSVRIPLNSANAEISLEKEAFVFDGTEKKPGCTVKKSDGTVIPQEQYQLVFDTDCRSIGTHKVKVEFTKDYEGSLEGEYKILPDKVKGLKKGKVKQNKLQIRWKEPEGDITGYLVSYSMDGSFKHGVKEYEITDAGRTSRKIKGINKSGYYYVRVTAYKRVDGIRYSSEPAELVFKNKKKK